VTGTAQEPNTGRRARRADAARNAAALLAAAKELFGRHGPEVALDDIARHAGVGNATLYRHFPTREDLLAAAYADEADALCRRGKALLTAPSPGEALFAWLDSFVEHVATMRTLALAATAGSDDRRSRLFQRWHESMTSTAEDLLARAREAGAVRPDLTARDLLALTNAAALAGNDGQHARHLVRILRHGVEVTRAP
jgi:AcrR family transcriptional regulator